MDRMSTETLGHVSANLTFYNIIIHDYILYMMKTRGSGHCSGDPVAGSGAMRYN